MDSVIHGLVLCLSPTQPNLLSPPAWADTSHTDPLCTRDSSSSSSASTAQHVTPDDFNTSQSAQPRKPTKTLPPKSPDPQGGVKPQRSSSANKSTPLGFKIEKLPAAKKKVQIQTQDDKRNRSGSPQHFHAKLFLKSVNAERRASNWRTENGNHMDNHCIRWVNVH